MLTERKIFCIVTLFGLKCKNVSHQLLKFILNILRKFNFYIRQVKKSCLITLTHPLCMPLYNVHICQINRVWKIYLDSSFIVFPLYVMEIQTPNIFLQVYFTIKAWKKICKFQCHFNKITIQNKLLRKTAWYLVCYQKSIL